MIAASLAFILALTPPVPAAAPPQSGGTVRVDVPTVLVFQVTNVTQPSVVSGFRVSYNQAKLGSGLVLRISVKAEGTLTIGGVSIPSSNITWTATQPTNGIGMNGTLSAAVYTPVYESKVNPSSGRVDLTWSLTLPPGITTAGSGQITLRWKLEASQP